MYKPPITISSFTLGTEVSFPDRVHYTATAGFHGIGLTAENYLEAKKAGLSDEEMLSILDEYEIKVTEVEYITQWGSEENRTASQQEKEQIIYHMARLFDVKHINFSLLEKQPEEQMIKDFDQLCKRAGDFIIGLEFMPYSGVPDLATAWRIAKAVNRDNAMLICDTWHWVRANQTYDMIKMVPAEKIVSIQLCDVAPKAYPAEILREESMSSRLFPGEGYGDTIGFAKMLKEHGVKPLTIGVDTISESNVSKGMKFVSEGAYDSVKKVLEEAWPEIAPYKPVLIYV